MDIKSILTKELGLKELTGPSLKEAALSYYGRLPDVEKRRISREIALEVIRICRTKDEKNGQGKKEPSKEPFSAAKVLAVNHAGLLDVTIEWKTLPGGRLELAGCRTDSGGDQINLSKVLSHFNEKTALVALTGMAGGEITKEWERKFLHNSILPSLIRSKNEDVPVAVYNIIDNVTLPAMFGWADELSSETVERMAQETLRALELMFGQGKDSLWMVLSAGGPIRYNKNLAYYASLVKLIKKKYSDRVKLLIDFKFVSGPEEAMSVLDIPRETPQDIIKPNLEEFMQILRASGLMKSGIMDRTPITEDAVKAYAIKLRAKYNLLGVLVSLDKAGLMLVMRDRIIKEKGIRIKLACPTGSGDSLKAGFVYALSNGRSFEEAVHTGNLFGASTASMEGTGTVTPEKLSETTALARTQRVEPEIEYIKPE